MIAVLDVTLSSTSLSTLIGRHSSGEPHQGASKIPCQKVFLES